MKKIKLLSWGVVVIALICGVNSQAQAVDCETMAEMAKNAMDLRNSGVPLSEVQKYLSNNISDTQELALGLSVATIVYRAEKGSSQKFKQMVLKECKNQ